MPAIRKLNTQTRDAYFMVDSNVQGLFIGRKSTTDGAGRAFGLIAPELEKLGTKLGFVPAKGIFSFAKSLVAHWLSSTPKVDFILFNSLGSIFRPEAYALAKFARAAGIPTIIYWREMAWSFAKFEKISPLAIKVADAIAQLPGIHHWANSKVCANYIAARYHLQNPVQVAGNCAATGFTIPEPLPPPSKPPCVVNVGSIQERKGVDLFVETAMEVCAKDDQIEFLWIGPGNVDPEIIAKIRAKRFEQRIRFVGIMEKPGVIVQHATVFFCPSREESYSQACAEAMSLGRNIVTFESGGPPEILSGTGTVIANFNTSAAAAAIIHYVRGTTTTNLAAKKLYEEHHSPPVHAQRLNRMIRDICRLK